MRGTTKGLLYGGAATAVLGPALVGGVVVSVLLGAGQFVNVIVNDGLPAAVSGVKQDIDVEPMFGDAPPDTTTEERAPLIRKPPVKES